MFLLLQRNFVIYSAEYFFSVSLPFVLDTRYAIKLLTANIYFKVFNSNADAITMLKNTLNMTHPAASTKR